jgi:LmbE family N-acetylglucosaminyl deacetylase
MIDVRASRPDAPLFISPHLDDAVFACGEVMTSSVRATVATVFAARPPAGAPFASWDADAGFRPGEDVIGARREEDREALAALGAHPVWLDFCDDQYGTGTSETELVEALAALIERSEFGAVYLPLGLFHADHVRASDAALALTTRFALPFRAYEDALYRRIPDLVAKRIEVLQGRGFRLSREEVPVEPEAHARKRDAVACYRSQIRALATRRGHADAFARESYWRVVRADRA